jgi:hypothetical protein
MKEIQEFLGHRIVTTPTMNLRFIQRGLRRVLQQQFECITEYDPGIPSEPNLWLTAQGSLQYEWRDVPFEA